MFDKIDYLEDGEKKYPMVFNLNVMELIQEQYGTIQDWGKMVIDSSEPNIKALKFMITEAINEGFDIEENDEKVTAKQVGRLITKLGLKEVAQKTNKLVIDSIKHGDTQKNVKTKKSQSH